MRVRRTRATAPVVALLKIHVLLKRKKAPGALREGDAPGPYYLNRDMIACGAWLAMERAWTPSCCLVCSAWSVALSLARSASTRLPMPVCRVSESLDTKFSCVVSALDLVPSWASEALTLLLQVSTGVIIAVAIAVVPSVSVALMVMIVPPRVRF